MAIVETNRVEAILTKLGLSQVEAARRLDVTDRTMRRWVQSGSAPGPARILLYTWALIATLKRCGLPVDTDYVSGQSQFGELSEDELAAEFQHAVELEEALARVKARGGPRHHWDVDPHRKAARLHSMNISFYRDRSGGFSPAMESSDIPQTERDDAWWCITRSLAASGWPGDERGNGEANLAPLGDWLVSISRPGIEVGDVLDGIRKHTARAADLEAE